MGIGVGAGACSHKGGIGDNVREAVGFQPGFLEILRGAANAPLHDADAVGQAVAGDILAGQFTQFGLGFEECYIKAFDTAGGTKADRADAGADIEQAARLGFIAIDGSSQQDSVEAGAVAPPGLADMKLASQERIERRVA